MIRMPRGSAASNSVGLSWDDVYSAGESIYDLASHAAPAAGAVAACAYTQNTELCIEAAKKSKEYYEWLKEQEGDPFTDGGAPVVVNVDTDNKVVYSGSDVATCKPSYLFYAPGFDSAEKRCGVPDYKAVVVRRAPGTSIEVFTPRNTYLAADPPSSPVPTLKYGPVPDGWFELGDWGNGKVYVPPGTTLQDVNPSLLNVVASGGEPAQEGGAGETSQDDSSVLGKVVGVAVVAGAIWAGYRYYKGRPVWPF